MLKQSFPICCNTIIWCRMVAERRCVFLPVSLVIANLNCIDCGHVQREHQEFHETLRVAMEESVIKVVSLVGALVHKVLLQGWSLG